jgi:hypothetical protein
MELVGLLRALRFVIFGGFVLFVVGLVYRLVRYGSFKGANFGAVVRETVGRVEIHSYRPTLSTLGLGLRIGVEANALAPSDDARGPHVGLMVRVRTFPLGFPRLIPLVLSRDDARELAALLTRASG